MASLSDRIKNSWNAFMGRDPTDSQIINKYVTYGPGYSTRPDRFRLSRGNDRSIVTSIYNQIAVDVSSVTINHVKLDENGKYLKTLDTPLNTALSRTANLDQTGRMLIKDVVMSMFDEGCVAIVPTVTNTSPRATDGYKIYELRTGKIVEWYTDRVKVELWNDLKGRKDQLIFEKSMVAIIENPFYSIMNEPNSTLKRLIRVLNQLDRTNESNSAGKLDLIIQLPYSVKNPIKKEQAEQRRQDIVDQLTGSQYGIAYADATEHITQLNRAVENNLWAQAKDLTAELYSQLGFAQSIFDGTADEKTMLNYYNRTIDPILVAIVEECERKWLSQTAITQRQAIRYFRDPFKLVPVQNLAEIADKFTRNEIMSSNEIRSIIGMKPSNDPKADELINSNLNHPEEEVDKKIDDKNQNDQEGGTENG